jgi:hypothetical protein
LLGSGASDTDWFARGLWQESMRQLDKYNKAQAACDYESAIAALNCMLAGIDSSENAGGYVLSHA